MQHDSLTIQNYEGNPIAFDFTDKHRLVNLSNMAKPFGKQPSDFTRQKHAQLFINELEKQSGDSPTGKDSAWLIHKVSVLVKSHGGTNPGTWGHELLALKFAGWLSPAFELWMMERIRKMLIQGSGTNKADTLPLLLFEDPPRHIEGEYMEAQRLAHGLSAVAGSGARLANRLGVSGGTLNSLLNGKYHYVRTPMLARLLPALRHLDRHGFGYDTELVELLMKVEDTEVRTQLFVKLKKTAIL